MTYYLVEVEDSIGRVFDFCTFTPDGVDLWASIMDVKVLKVEQRGGSL